MRDRLLIAARAAIDAYPGTSVENRRFDDAMRRLAEECGPDDRAAPACTWHEGGGAHWLVNDESKVIARVVPYKHGDGTEIHVVVDLKDNEQIGLYWGIDAAKESAEGLLL